MQKAHSQIQKVISLCEKGMFGTSNILPKHLYMPPNYLEAVSGNPAKTYSPDLSAAPPSNQPAPFFQVWSLSSFNVSCPLLINDLIQVSSVSLLMAHSTALANEGLFELTRCPSLTPGVSLSFAETTEEPGCCQIKRPKNYSLVPL